MSIVEQAALNAWRALPWRLFTRCVDCGEYGNCAGVRRQQMRCLSCWDIHQ